MKKLLSLIITIAMLMSTAVFAADIPPKTEIKFKLGDSILSINGNDVEVPAPFVVGEGTTMVPVRVITEAFGATVGWDGTEQKITIDYPDVQIIMHIGSRSVSVNDHAETLAEAPVIANGDTTMIPLRFISETFGAVVGWDQETQGITVTKDNEAVYCKGG